MTLPKTKSQPEAMMGPAERFGSCRWRSHPEVGEFCTHPEVRSLAGEASFNPEAWCGDCALYKARRTVRPHASPSTLRTRDVGPTPDVVGFGSSQTLQYFTGHSKR